MGSRAASYIFFGVAFNSEHDLLEACGIVEEPECIYNFIYDHLEGQEDVKLLPFSSEWSPAFGLMIKESEVWSDWHEPTELRPNKMVETDEWVEKIQAVCKKMGIKEKLEPKWYLASDYS